MNETQAYIASIPERTVRTGAALVGGFVNETTSVFVPLAIRRTKLYQATVARLLRIIIELVGDVRGVYPAEPITAQQLFFRKTAGNVVEVAGFFAVGWSPVWLLAAASDLIGGSKLYLHTLVEELKTAEVLRADAEITSFETLLTTLEGTSGALADTIDLPPLKVAEVRSSWQELQTHTAALPTADRLASIFNSLQVAAHQEGRSLLSLSSVVALGAVRAGLQLGEIHIFAYYRDALQTVAHEGLITYLRRVSTPYLSRAVGHFDHRADTVTQRLLRWWARRRQAVAGEKGVDVAVNR